MYAFSRDDSIPGSEFLHKVDHRWRSPIRPSIVRIGSVNKDFLFAFVTVRTSLAGMYSTLSFILGLPSISSSVAFSMATSFLWYAALCTAFIIVPPGAQPGQPANSQLRARRRRDRPYPHPGLLGAKRREVVLGTYQADRCARPLLLFR